MVRRTTGQRASPQSYLRLRAPWERADGRDDRGAETRVAFERPRGDCDEALCPNPITLGRACFITAPTARDGLVEAAFPVRLPAELFALRVTPFVFREAAFRAGRVEIVDVVRFGIVPSL